MDWLDRVKSNILRAKIVGVQYGLIARDWGRRLSAKCLRFFKIIREFIWPSMGWNRFLRLMTLRISRLSGSEKSVARGLACGAALSMTPLIGLHFALSATLAKLIRGNIVAAIVGTVVGNPWTFPFIWGGTFKLGSEIIERHSGRSFKHKDLDLWDLITHPWEIFLPMLIGSIPVMLIIFPLTYWSSCKMLQWIHEKKAQNQARRKQKQLAKLRAEEIRQQNASPNKSEATNQETPS